ncbi:MAG: chemotaxis protein CheA [Bacteroidota bacterium]|nr:chemotaxis protein CheA [Bacteroidota bacterium]
MNARDREYREIFIAEALEIYDGLSNQVIALEKDPGNEKILGELFRFLHNLKANSKAIGFTQIADIAHKLENIFSSMRNKQLVVSSHALTILFDGIDLVGHLIKDVDNTELDANALEVISNIDHLASLGEGEEFDQPVKKYYTSQNIALSEQIYIPIRKLDDLLNLVGELIIDRDRILTIAARRENAELNSVAAHLYRITSSIQNSVMDARLITIGSLFNKFPRIVRDVAMIEGKEVELEIYGQDIRIDRNILQIITDSLLHLVRNSITHGIESNEKRVEQGKKAAGRIILNAQSDKDKVLIQVIDDGRGIDIQRVRHFAVSNNYITPEKAKEMTDKEVIEFIFEPGFSTSTEVNEISGRGVGLDIVKTAIDSIGGRITVESLVGKGTTFSLFLPTSIAVKGALLFKVDDDSYAIPLVHIDSVATIPNTDIHQLGASMILDIKNETIPVISLIDLFSSIESDDQSTGSTSTLQDGYLHIIIVTHNNRKLGLIVERLLRQQDIVVKALQRPIDQIDLFGGVTLLGNGEVCLVLDVPALSKQFISKTLKGAEELN